MDACEVVDQAGAAAQPNGDNGGTLKEKRTVKLTAKAFAEKLDKLQTVRKAKLNKANDLRKQIQGLMDTKEKGKVQDAFGAFVILCDEAKGAHDSLMSVLPDGEKEKHATWFKAKMLFYDEFVFDVKTWVSCAEHDLCGDIDNDGDHINPEDSVSNVGSRRSSQKSLRSGRSSTTSSVRIKAEADRAALIARVAVLKEKHKLEEQEQQLKARKEQLELEAMLAASTAKLAVLQASDARSASKAYSDGMNSYLEREAGRTAVSKTLEVKEFKPVISRSSTQQNMESVLPSAKPLPQVDAQAQRLESSIPDAQLTNRGQFAEIFTIMHRQNEITAALVQQQQLCSLPPRDIPVFDGDPLQYNSFIKAFEQGVEKKANKCDCLYYLEQFTRGQPRELVHSCQHMNPDHGYAQAKRLLKEHFGNEYKIASAYMERALTWPSIKPEDVKALQAYSLFLRGCCNVMEELQYMQELDMPTNMRAVMSKLPFKLRERWRTTAYDILKASKRRALFQDLVAFIERHVGIISDPLFGDIRDLPSRITCANVPNKLKSHPGGRVRGNSFATTIAPIKASEKSGDLKIPLLTHGSAMRSSCEICICCSQGHSLEDCQQFNRRKHRDKMYFLKEKQLCFGCLGAGHRSQDCNNRLICRMCGQNHPTVLHIATRDMANSQVEYSRRQVASKSTTLHKTCGHTGAGKDKCLLSILPVQVKSIKGGQIIQTYAFLDPGSSATFCSEHLMHRLSLTGKRTNFLLQTMGQERVVPAYSLSGLEVSGLETNHFYQLPETLTQKKMPVSTDNIVHSEDLARWPYLAGVHVPHIEAKVDLLIGSNAPKILEPWEVINSRGDGPYAIRTALGWVVNGPLVGDDSTLERLCPSAIVNRISVSRLEEMLINQYNHDFNERITEEKGMSVEDVKFMEIVKGSATLEDGHYCLKLPFKRSNISLPNNFSVAKQRLLGLERKFLNNERYYQEYAACLNDVIKKGYAEKVSSQQLSCESGKLWYIPHHGVYHPRKKTLRVVFDCGAAYKGTSLNQQLLQGPNLTSTLLGVLLRFRQGSVAVMGDIEAMFHQVKVAKEDRDFLRFVWWPEGDLSKEVAQYRMTVHLFGAVSSPSCASFALRKTAEDNQPDFPSEVAQTVQENFYVDDCLKSIGSEKEAVLMVKNLTALCQKGGFTLTKWTSNSRIVLQSIPEEARAKDLKELDLDRDKLPVERALGLQWCIKTDSFKFKMELSPRPHTRRGLLSVSSSVYDPLGFLAPIVLPAKIMLQELCRRNLGWDETIPHDIMHQWTRWLKDLDMLAAFKVERCIKPKEFGRLIHMQLHHFSDASETGYGTVTYLRIQNGQADVHIAFLLGKARVTPLKTITIPRLELTAAVLAVKVDLMLKAELQLQLQESVFWTDSTSVLKYINNEDKRFHTFVSNRVSTIRGATRTSQWRYVCSKDNPADVASRGANIGDFIRSNRWLNGPDFLWKPERDWPANPVEAMSEADDPEVKREAVVNMINVKDSLDATGRLISYFSDWMRLKIAVAWLLKLKKILLEKSRRKGEMKTSEADDQTLDSSNSQQTTQRSTVVLKPSALSVDDLLEAELAIVRYCQQQQFQKEIAALSSGRSTVSRQSVIYRLDPYLDDGLLRVGGRLIRGSLPEESKHPLILSKHQHVSSLILKHIHQHLGHSGRNHTLSTLRRKYWITNANSAVRKIITECGFCRRYNGRMGEQKMSDLPKERILPDLPPFTNTGVDYFGPIEVKRGRGSAKRYGVIFTCLASRAVHLEVADSLDTDACINALRRFICRRGQVDCIYSDNGTNFVGAERELREALASLNHRQILGALQREGVRWIFNPPAGSHHGGVWERLIRMVRKILGSVLQQQKLDDDRLRTVMCEVEAILNDRPLTKLSDDPNDLEPLTPNHILLMKGRPALPPGLFEPHDFYVKRRWRQVQYIADLFWKRWVREYLPLLQERQKWNQKRRNLKPGDIVIIMDATAPRGSWPLGRILEVFKDKKGLVRSVRLHTKTNVIDRPVTKLCLLHEAAV